MQQNILIWDAENQIFREIAANRMVQLLLPENTKDCLLFLAWLPHIKSIFLYKRNLLEIVCQDGTTYNFEGLPYLYDKLFAIRHGA